jgi:hypothetical protein
LGNLVDLLISLVVYLVIFGLIALGGAIYLGYVKWADIKAWIDSFKKKPPTP